MSERVKSKLQQLIHELEGGPSQAAEQQGENAPTAEIEDSSVSLGLSELTPTDITDGNGSEATPGTHHVLSGIHQPSSIGLKRHVAELENKVLELLLDRKAAEARHARELALKDAELARLQHYIDEELAELQRRQAQVEGCAPAVKLQLQEARASLRDLVISDEKYQQLKKVPNDRLSLADAVRIAAHDLLGELCSDNERLRVSAAASREACIRLEGEVSRLQRENARLAAAVADKDAAVEGSLVAMESRAAQLAAELEEAALQLEVAKAKAALYGDLQAKVDKLEGEVARLSGFEAVADRLRAQLAAVDAAAGDRDATLSLLTADKAYLTKEVQVCEERLSELTIRLEQQESKVTQLKAERQELYQKLAEVHDMNRSQDESRLEREVSRLQAAASADLERIRREATETTEREARMLRDLRDAALDEASRLKAELRQLRQSHEDLLVSSREGASRADIAYSELLGECKVKGFELKRLQALCEDRGNAVHQLSCQAELLAEKVKLMTAELARQEQDSRQTAHGLQQRLEQVTAQLKEYQLAGAVLDKAIAKAGTAGDSAVLDLEQQLAALLPTGQQVPTVSQLLPFGAASGSLGTATPNIQEHQQPQQQQEQQHMAAALHHRIHHNIQLAARCARLEADKQQLAAEKAETMNKLAKAQAVVGKLHQQVQLAGQPHGYLLAQLQQAEAAARQAKEELTKAKEALRLRDQQAQAATIERAALRRDLERILKERGALDSMRSLVAAAVAPALTARSSPMPG